MLRALNRLPDSIVEACRYDAKPDLRKKASSRIGSGPVPHDRHIRVPVHLPHANTPRELQSALEDWIVFGLVNGYPIPPIDEITITTTQVA